MSATHFRHEASVIIHSCCLAILMLTGMPAALAAIANINPAQDNTVAEDFPDNSSGACDSIFSGSTDLNFARRALMQFDIAAQIPAGSIINSASLGMTVTRGGNHDPSTFSLHPVSAAWVEGIEGCGVRGGGQGETSSGGVTWNTMPGFGPASGDTIISNTSPVWNSTATMVSNIQNWLDNPANNYGWVLIGDETTKTTTRRFDSKEGGSPPVLTVDFTPTGAVEACCQSNGSCSLTVVSSGTCTGTVQTGISSCDPNPCPQPNGACCNVDNSCSTTDALTCTQGGGTFVGGNCNQADCGLEPFLEPLPIPGILPPTGFRPDGVPQFTVSIEPASQSVHPGLPATSLWTYNGSWPSSTIVASKGQTVEVTYINNLPAGGGKRGSNLLEVDTCAHGPNYWGTSKRVVTHLHGGHVPAAVDGQPEYHILPGETDVYEYPIDQDAGTVWYHDHALGITRLNVYGGMAGFFLIADDEDTLGPDNAFGLPSGPYEIGLAIQDRSFNDDGTLFYNAQLEDAFKGEYAVVNGKVSPYLEVDQGKYRFRILNGSQSREYRYRLENITDPGNDPEFLMIGTDLGLIDGPNNLGSALAPIAPAERLDVVIDFSGYPAGTEIILRNDDTTPPLLPSIMKFIVTDDPGYTGQITPTLRPVTPMPEGSADTTRYFRLEKKPAVECKDGSGRLVNEWLVQSLDGPGGNVTGEEWDDLTEFPALGTREVWEFENPTNVMHPMHVHLVRFQIVSKTDLNTGQPIPLEPWETNTWKDIVRIPAKASARIIMDFEDYPGRFPQHCHILDHEDHEMMRQFQTVRDQVYCNNDAVCDPYEDCVSCPGDCALVSGALCGNGLCEAGDGENCLTCPSDCAGKQSGAASKMFCCGFDDGQATNPINCGVNINDNRCIDASSGLFCRQSQLLQACCGDRLCEGAETDTACAIDCDAGYRLDSDDDGIPDPVDPYPNDVDGDGDGLCDGPLAITGICLAGEDSNANGKIDSGESDPMLVDTDGDGYDDGMEVRYGSDPASAADTPENNHVNNGDVNGMDGVTGADLLLATRIALGLYTPSALEKIRADMVPDEVINAADLVLILAEVMQ